MAHSRRTPPISVRPELVEGLGPNGQFTPHRFIGGARAQPMAEVLHRRQTKRYLSEL